MKRSDGKTKHPLYRTYIGIKSRCYDSNHMYFDNYGGRGIKICDRWLGVDGFDNFINDIGMRPSRTHILGRIDKNGNYEPSNCRWTTPLNHGRGKHLAKNNTSGCTGVTWDGRNHQWKVVLRHNNISKYLGRYDDLDKAIDVRRSAEADLMR